MPRVRIILTLLAAMSIALLPGIAPAAQGVAPQPVEIDGFPLSLSPDGSLIAGMDAEGMSFCVWDRATLEANCDGELPDPLDARSLAWAPDSSAVAFSLAAQGRLADSDVYVFEAGGTLHNLTDDDPDNTGADEVSFLVPQENPVPIDRYPTWSPDGTTLLFARTMWGDENAPGAELMTISRDGGEPERRAALEDMLSLPIAGPMFWREDGSVVFSTVHPDPAHPSDAIHALDPEGTLRVVHSGTTDDPLAQPILADISPDGTAVSAWSRVVFHEGLLQSAAPVFFHVDLATGEATPWEAYPGVALEDGARLLAPPVFGPDGAVAFLWRMPAGGMGVSVLDASGAFRTVTPVEYNAGGMVPRGINGIDPTLVWADDGTLLLILDTGGMLIPVEGSAATPVASPAG